MCVHPYYTPKALLDFYGSDEMDSNRCPLDKLIVITAIVGRQILMSPTDLQGAVFCFFFKWPFTASVARVDFNGLHFAELHQSCSTSVCELRLINI